MGGLQNNFQNHRRVPIFYRNRQVSECHNKLFEEGYWKDFKISKQEARKTRYLIFLAIKAKENLKTTNANTECTDLTL
jgi:hypothetical protein